MGAATALLTLKYETPDFVIADCPFADSKLLFAQWLKRNLHIPIGLIWPILRRRAKRKSCWMRTWKTVFSKMNGTVRWRS